MLNTMTKLKQLVMLVVYKSIKIVVDSDNIYCTADRNLFPSKFEKLLENCCRYDDNLLHLYYPYINSDSFKLFLNLILTPDNITVTNPKNLTLEDLEPVFMTFTDYYGNDYDIVKNIKDRYEREFQTSEY